MFITHNLRVYGVNFQAFVLFLSALIGLKVLLDFHNQEYVYHFLMGLHESFAQIRGQILLINPFPGINKVFSLVIQEERQREVATSYSMPAIMPSAMPIETIALVSKTEMPSQGKVYRQ